MYVSERRDRVVSGCLTQIDDIGLVKKKLTCSCRESDEINVKSYIIIPWPQALDVVSI